MFFHNDSLSWASDVFGLCMLGDPRRRNRVVDIARRLADEPSGSINRICKNDSAAREGSYKLIENSAVRPEDIREGFFAHTAKIIPSSELVLAVQDTTTLSFSHSIGDELRENGSSPGFQVHSTLLLRANDAAPIGLIDQQVWLRAPKNKRPGKKTRRKREYKDKESYKWYSAFERMKGRLSSTSNVVTVCDREADIYEFLQQQLQSGGRFVVRLTRNRALQNQAGYLHEAISKFTVLGEREVAIAQRGAQKATITQHSRKSRTARTAMTQVAAGNVHLKPSRNSSTKGLEPLSVNVVHVYEPGVTPDETPISWMLLTTEPVGTLEQATAVIDMYAARWKIEEFHKAWKTGCRIESRKLQSLENAERMMAMTAPVAVRVLQIKSTGENQPEKSCESIASPNEWKCLWMIIEKTTPPDRAPDAAWFYRSLAKLAGWFDSKKTGRAGWQTLWRGWEDLRHQTLGWEAAMKLMGTIDA